MTDIDATTAHGHQPGDPMELAFRVAALTAEVERLRDAYKCAHADRLARALERDRTIDEREHLKAEVERLERLAYTDPLTGLANRRALEAEMQRRQDSGQPHTVCVIDVNGLKSINDAWGHATGDDAIVAVADQLNETAEAHGGLAARLGGDEFVLVGPPGIDADLMDRLADPLGPGVTVSVGVCHARPSDVWRRVLRAADIALYQAKALHRGESVAVTFDCADRLPTVPVRPKVRVRDERAVIAEVIA